MRITENTINDLIKEINRLEAIVNPQDTNRHQNGKLWRYDYFANEGLYINRGNANPVWTNKRITPKECFAFLTGVEHVLFAQANKLTSLE